MLDAFEHHLNEPAVYTTKVRMLGTGAAAPTKVIGSGVTVTRDGVGIYTLTWSDPPGTWAGPSGESFQATTSANVKGCSVSWGVYDATAKSVQFKVWDVAGAARELAALEWLTVHVDFKRTGV